MESELHYLFYKMLRGDISHPPLGDYLTLDGERKPISFHAADEKILTAFYGESLKNQIRKKEQAGHNFLKDEIEELLLNEGKELPLLDLLEF